MAAVNLSGVNLCSDSRRHSFWELFSWSGARVAVFFTFYFALLTLSVAMNCWLLYLTAVRHRYPSKPHYTILQNLAVCNILIGITPCVYLLPNALQGRTATLSNWCVSFVGIMGSLLLACQMTLALMAVERYIFICHGLHYLRVVTPGHVRRALGVIWSVVWLLSVNYGVLFSRKWRHDYEPIETLICDPLTFEKYTELTSIDMLQFHGPSTVIVVATFVVIVACYLLMLRAAYKVALELRQSHRTAVSTVGFYLVMVLVQMLPMICAGAMVSLRTIDHRRSHLLLVFLTTVPPLVNAAVPLYGITEFRHSLLSLCRDREDQSPAHMREIRRRRGRLMRGNCETAL